MNAADPGKRGSNSARVRRYNERIVLHFLRKAGTASKAELARTTSLTNAAIGVIIQNLLEEGLIEELGKRHDGGRGQPATLLRLAPDGAYGFGVRIGRLSLETVLLDFSGRVVGRQFHDMAYSNLDSAIDEIRRDISRLTDLIDTPNRINGIGLACLFRASVRAHNLGLHFDDDSEWSQIAISSALSNATDLTVFSLQDGTAGALAELIYGEGRTDSTYLYLSLSATISGGIVQNGEVLRGVSGNAGDVGVIPVPPSNLASAVPQQHDFTPLYHRASLMSLARHIVKGDISRVRRGDIEQALLANGPEVAEWLDDCAAALAHAICATHALLDIPAVVLEADLDQGILSGLIKRLTLILPNLIPADKTVPRIVKGQFGQEAPAIGAATLPMFYNFSPRPAILTGSDPTEDQL